MQKQKDVQGRHMQMLPHQIFLKLKKSPSRGIIWTMSQWKHDSL